jgi:hypothetical protein
MTTGHRTPRRHDGDQPSQFAAIVWRITDPTPTKHWFDHPVDALTSAVDYLKAGYQCRLSDGCVEYFAHLPRPDSASFSANGEAALLAGPPREAAVAEARFQPAPEAP